MKKVLLSIAGFDPTGGAGVLLDQKVFLQLGFPGMGLLTAITEQNTEGVQSLFPLPSDFLLKQYRTLVRDVTLRGIKVGMTAGRKQLGVIRDILIENNNLPIVLDPVLKSTSGYALGDKDSLIDFLGSREKTLTLITPNMEEAAAICGQTVENVRDMEKAARRIHSLTGTACLIKGGHLKNKKTDVFYDGQRIRSFSHEAYHKRVHGSGCFYSSAVLCFIVRGLALEEACGLAAEITHEAIKKAIQVGQGQMLFSFPPDPDSP
jgi:hydroxymethylpyrimidine/phosphomethylpyrimidine kinase